MVGSSSGLGCHPFTVVTWIRNPYRLQIMGTTGKVPASSVKALRVSSILSGPTIWSARLSIRTPGFHPGQRGLIPRQTAKNGPIF